MATKGTKKKKVDEPETKVYDENDINGDEGIETINSDAKGNGYLPGTEPVVVKPLIEKVKELETILKPNFAAARDALVKGKTELADLVHNNMQHFTKQPNGEMVYSAAGATITVKMEKEVIKTDLDDESDDLDA